MTKVSVYEVSGISRAGYLTKVRVEATSRALAKAQALRRGLVKVSKIIEVNYD